MFQMLSSSPASDWMKIRFDGIVQAEVAKAPQEGRGSSKL